ncbi:hypothetical protein [Granulosicoccus antarcticus]|uniref:Uncharacterized protein n=1 Tax=Granulosicoccus antarcticus IMCC3135 TaxID=1192854 RepID=A0A2Z2NTA6_9GAMM|nr:hypothetical protein [Granulosicoccus antarcticus]ASJ71980.1 hypothetical protein IMCC3135_09415 [Granulosicoccus antarcticus IMCC3135]
MTQTGHQYRTWQDLADEPVEIGGNSSTTDPCAVPIEPAPPALSVAPSVSAGGIMAPAGMRLDDLNLPGELNELLREYQALEAKMRNLAGESSAEEIDKRDAARFPIKTHTVESRIEDRRLARHDEGASLQKKAALEEATIKQRLESRRENMRQHTRLAAISAGREQEQQEHLERAKAVKHVVEMRAATTEGERRETTAREATNRSLLAVQRKRRLEQAHMAETGERARATLVSRRSKERDINRRRELIDKQQTSASVERRRDAHRDEARRDAARARLIEQRREAKQDEAALDRRRSNCG